MSTVKRLRREDWEQKLRICGCHPAEGLAPLHTAEWWRWPWPAPPFAVPVDDEGCLDLRSYHRLIADMVLLAPPDWQLPD